MDIEEVIPTASIFDSKKIQIQNRIGRGSQGSVYNAYNEQSMQRYAIKVMNTSCMTEKERQRLKCQIQSNFTLSSKQHFIYFPYFYGYWTTQKQAYLVFQRCQGNALEGISLNRTPASSYIFSYILLYDIINALSLLETRNIIHRDLKPENILLDKGFFKICDLGLSRIVEKGKKLTMDVGNIMSRSPQFYTGSYDCKTDIWSLGINVFWLAFGSLPFNQEVKMLIKEKKVSEIIAKISKRDFKIDMGKLESQMTHIIKSMLQIDTDKRLSASQILSHYFEQLKFDKNDLNLQIKFLFFTYLPLRSQSEYNSKIVLIIILLVVDFTRMDDQLRKSASSLMIEEKQADRLEESRRQIIKRVKFNIYCILKNIWQQEKQYLNLQIAEIIDYYLTVWKYELECDQKWRKKVQGQKRCLESCLDMHKAKKVSDKFPLVVKAVELYRSLDCSSSENTGERAGESIWNITGLDLRKYKI